MANSDYTKVLSLIRLIRGRLLIEYSPESQEYQIIIQKVDNYGKMADIRHSDDNFLDDIVLELEDLERTL